ncbi:unnamed protein product [Fraxinus pennsylvanica]|uniref:Uncharacterized protein n=1 Tax=Fraxinus pennsylvanica TaxID=56036 RepID=A0AAD1Z6S8_9LAMI|nr:unnamed protein product [Fraxinus pennsylvanica]
MFKNEKVKARETFRISSALQETVASVAVAATFLGAAATILRRRIKSSEVTETKTEGVDLHCELLEIQEQSVLFCFRLRLNDWQVPKKAWEDREKSGFPKSGATAQNVLQLDPVVYVEAVGR